MRSANRQRPDRVGPGVVALLSIAFVALASVPGQSAARAVKRAHVGDVTYVTGTTAKVVGHNAIKPGGSPDVKSTTSAQVLLAGDVLQTGDSTIQFNVRIGQKHAYCTTKANSTVQVSPSSTVLLDFKSGTSFCGTDPTGGKKTMRIGAYVTITAADPVFEVSTASGTKTLKVNQGALIVGGKQGSTDAVVLGRRQQTVVRAAGRPSTPTKTQKLTPTERSSLNRIQQALPPVTDTHAPTTVVTGPHDPSSLRTAAFTFSASESAITFSCALDDTDFRVCTSSLRYDRLAPGPHRFAVKATDAAGNVGPVAVSRWTIDGSRIAFESNRDGNFEIYSMNPDGTDAVNLTQNPANDQDPAWSPDRKHIAFQSSRNGNFEIYVMNPDGTNPTRITNDAAADTNPAWSPDGTQIVFESNRDDNNEIYAVNLSGSGLRQLTANAADDIDPDWSKTGRIVFSSDRSGNYQIYVMNANGTGQTQLTSNIYNEFGPNWSPDGTQIAFNSNRDGVSSKIYLMTASGASQNPLTSSSFDDHNPAWAPDGHEIAIQSNRDGNEEIYMVSLDDKSLSRLTFSTGTGPSDDLTPDW